MEKGDQGKWMQGQEIIFFLCAYRNRIRSARSLLAFPMLASERQASSAEVVCTVLKFSMLFLWLSAFGLHRTLIVSLLLLRHSTQYTQSRRNRDLYDRFVYS